jgi:5-methylcytosine-specific restriction endonuclease McrA
MATNADHIVSRRNGGSHHPDSLRVLCDSCNAAKTGLVDARSGGVR